METIEARCLKCGWSGPILKTDERVTPGRKSCPECKEAISFFVPAGIRAMNMPSSFLAVGA